MTNRWLIGWLWLFWLVVVQVQASGAAPVVDVEYSHRQAGSGWSPPTIVEGHIQATFNGDRSISLLEPDTTFVRINSVTFERKFMWWETDTLTVVFVDDDGEQTEVRAFPEPVYPLDPENHDLPVVHVTTDPANLWDPEFGIYTYGEQRNWNQRGEEWERPAIFNYWDAAGNLAISRPIGLRIHGGYSRSYPQKSFRFYFDHDGEPESVEYPFFNGEEGEYERLILRSCYHPGKMINDHWACSLFADMGNLISNISFLVAYLNNEYWGVFHLRERLDDEWAETTLGLDSEEYILLLDGEAVHGDSDEWWDFLDWVNGPADFTSHDFYVQASSRLDLSTYIDWLLVNIFAAPSDNGYMHNLALLKVDGNPWRFVMWDEDDLFEEENLDSNYFRFFSAGNAEEFQTWLPPAFGTDDWAEVEQWFGLFNHLMDNAEFRTRFFNRYDELAADLMSLENLRGRLDGIKDLQSPEVDWHGNKYWYGNGWPYTYYASDVMSWITSRHAIVSAQKANFQVSSLAAVELSRFDASVEPGGHRLTWRTEAETDCDGFAIHRSAAPDGPFDLIVDHTTAPELVGQGAPRLPAEYSFLLADVPFEGPSYYRLSHFSSASGEVVHNWVEGVDVPFPQLRINEIMARNSSTIADETGAFEDWVEIYNDSETVVDLGGMFLTDKLNEPTQWVFPEGILIPAGGFLLVWCDDDLEDGPLHTSFKLSGGGETIALFDRLDNGNQLIDLHVFGVQSADVSEGRLCDGCTEWGFFEEPTPEASNGSLSGTVVEVPSLLAIDSVAPNPFNPTTTVTFSAPAGEPVRLVIYNAAGRRVRVLLDGAVSAGQKHVVWDGRDDGGRGVASGLYQVRLESAETVRTRKVMLLK